MTNIVKESLSTTWIIYGILGAILVFLSNLFITDEETFVYISILYAILGIILLIISKYNKPVKKISFEEEFREDLENLTQSTPEDETNSDSSNEDALAKITADAKETLKKHKDPELSPDQSMPTTHEAFTTISNNGLYY